MENTANTSNAITEGVIWKQMLRYFLPLLLGSLFQQLYNTIDAIVVGRFAGPAALAAVGGSASMIILLFVGFFTGLSTGASVCVAQYIGAKDDSRASLAVHTALAMSVIGGLLFMVICIITAPQAIDLLRTPADTRTDSILYLRIYFCGMIPNLMYNMGSAVLRAAGDSRRPLYILIVSCAVNIVLDIIFVALLKQGAAGAAAATIISQAVSAVIVLIILTSTAGSCHVYIKKIRLHKDMLLRMLRIGMPAGIEALMYTISNLMIQASINSFGTDTVSAWAAYGKLDAAFWIMIQSLGISVTTFAGQNYGAGKYKRVRASTRSGLIMSLIMTLILTVILTCFARPLMMLFTSDRNVIDIGTDMVDYLARFYVLYICIEILSGALRGIGESFRPMIITLLGTCILRIAWILTAVPKWPDIYTVEASYPITWSITTVLLIILYLRRTSVLLKKTPADHA